MKIVLAFTLLILIVTEEAHCESGFFTSDIVAKYENREVLNALASQFDDIDVNDSENEEGPFNVTFNNEAEIRGKNSNLRKEFRRFDKNNDGFISKKEFKKYIKSLLKDQDIDINSQEFNETFDLIDSDGDGKISFEEFKNIPNIPLPKIVGFLIGLCIGIVVGVVISK